MDKATASSGKIQGLYDFAHSEGSFYSLLAKVELARFLDGKRLELKGEKPDEILASEDHG